MNASDGGAESKPTVPAGMKVYGLSESHDGQHRGIVLARNGAEAARKFGVTESRLRTYGSETGNREEIRLAVEANGEPRWRRDGKSEWRTVKDHPEDTGEMPVFDDTDEGASDGEAVSGAVQGIGGSVGAVGGAGGGASGGQSADGLQPAGRDTRGPVLGTGAANRGAVRRNNGQSAVAPGTGAAPDLAALKKNPKADVEHIAALQKRHAEGSPEWEALETARHNAQNVHTRDNSALAALHGGDKQRGARHFALERLASAAAQAHESGDAAGHKAATDAVTGFGGTLHGPAAGETVAHDPSHYDGPAGAFTGDAVRVTRQPVTYNGALVYRGKAEPVASGTGAAPTARGGGSEPPKVPPVASGAGDEPPKGKPIGGVVKWAQNGKLVAEIPQREGAFLQHGKSVITVGGVTGRVIGFGNPFKGKQYVYLEHHHGELPPKPKPQDDTPSDGGQTELRHAII